MFSPCSIQFMPTRRFCFSDRHESRESATSAPSPMDAGIFVQAVDTLHSPTATPAQRAAANDWLVAFAAVAEAASVCEAVLRWPGASAAALCFAANVVATSAAQLGAAAAMPLLQMCASVPSRAAAARLAQAAPEP